MPDTISLSPVDLLIDEENPRIAQPNAGQSKALQALAKNLGPKLYALADHIVKFGLNPGDLPYVMRQTGSSTRHIVLEGNRRLAALRALENPDALGDAVPSNLLSKFRQLSKQYHDDPVEQIDCVLFKSRDEARPWIELRHTGENAGAGIVGWGADESARYRARTGTAEPHTQALDFLQQQGSLSADVRAKVPTTSFKRLIETPKVRERLGVEVQKGVLYILADPNKVATALMHVIDDFATGKKRVGDIYTKEQREEYAKKLPSHVVVKPTMKSGHGVSALTGVPAAPTAKGGKVVTLRKKRDRLIPRDCVLEIPAGRVKDIEDELRRMSLDNHTNAVSVLFRVFIELSLDSYIDARALTNITRDSSLAKKMDHVAADLVARKKLSSAQRTPVSRATQRDSFLAPSVMLMHQYVHNQHVFPAPGDLRANWDSLQAFLAAIWKP